ncbi:protein-tyrosine phosphatase-like protein, partial [Endogone sp. FLAS-F59071]
MNSSGSPIRKGHLKLSTFSTSLWRPHSKLMSNKSGTVSPPNSQNAGKLLRTFKTAVHTMANIQKKKLDDPSVELEPQLYISGLEAVTSPQHLREKKITHVLSLGDSQVELTEELKANHRRVDIQDESQVDILKYIPETVAWMETALKDKNAKLLVHCDKGISRSTSFMAAYFMKRDKIKSKEAIEKITNKRPKANPKTSFRAQLDLYYDMGFKFDEDNLTYRQFLFNLAAWAKPNSFTLGLDPESIPGSAGDGGRDPDLRRSDDYMLICKRCKRGLAKKEQIANHVITEEEKAAVEASDKLRTMISVKCNYYFIEATRWMWGSPTFDNHRIYCSDCGTELGRHSSEGFDCECGRKALPGFCIEASLTQEAYRWQVEDDRTKFTTEKAEEKVRLKLEKQEREKALAEQQKAEAAEKSQAEIPASEKNPPPPVIRPLSKISEKLKSVRRESEKR